MPNTPAPMARLPKDCEAEMRAEAKRLQVPMAHIIRMGWHAIKSRLKKWETPKTIDVNAIYRKGK